MTLLEFHQSFTKGTLSDYAVYYSNSGSFFLHLPPVLVGWNGLESQKFHRQPFKKLKEYLGTDIGECITFQKGSNTLIETFFWDDFPKWSLLVFESQMPVLTFVTIRRLIVKLDDVFLSIFADGSTFAHNRDIDLQYLKKLLGVRNSVGVLFTPPSAITVE